MSSTPTTPSSHWIAWVGLAVFGAATALAAPKLVTSLFSTTGFAPHGYCYRWEPGLLWMHVAADAMIAGAYLSIPVALATFVRRRPDLPFHWIYLLFAVFIVSCGINHLMEIWLLWNPHYWLAGLLKSVTAAASVPTAIATVLLIPKALQIPSVEQLRRTKEALESEVLERRRIEEELRRAQAELEDRVSQRTADLARVSGDLRSSNALLDTLFEQAPIGFGVWDLQRRYLRVNRELARINGIEPAAHIGRTVPELLPEIGPDVDDALREVAASGRARREQETVGRTPAAPDESRHWQVSYFPIGIDGETIAVAATCIDVTAARRAEQERIRLLRDAQAARAEAELANRSKDDFLATVSHELRTPLQAMTGWLQLVQSGRLDADQRRHALMRIERNVRAQTRLIEDLVDLSRIVAGKLDLHCTPNDARLFITDALDGIRPVIAERDLRLEVAIDDTPLPVFADPDRMRQVIANLLANAVKFTPAGGTIRLAATTESSMLRVVVEDSGMGIEPDLLPVIFERYRQGRERPVTSGNGLGLGLSIVRHIVELHRGTVRASSDGPGCGARFVVRLPLDRTDAGAAGASSPGEPAPAAPGLDDRTLAGLTVLVVEDAPDTRHTLTEGLRLYGATVLAAPDAREGLRLAGAHRPAVVVSDIGLPDVDGYAFARQLGAMLPDVPLIALTAYGDEGDRRRASESGFVLHLTKPIRLEELVVYLLQFGAGSAAGGRSRADGGP